MTSLFISDLHLTPKHPEITAIFLKFLQTQAKQAENLYILGDFFEAWVGDDDDDEFNVSIVKALKQLSDEGVKIYFMHGNRDFLVGKQFAKATGCELLPDPCVIELYGEKILLMHGDLLCTLDKNYQKARRIFHNKLVQKAFLLSPLWLRKKIARKIRNRLERRPNITDTTIFDVTPEEIPKIMNQHKIKTLIHGHTHEPGIHILFKKELSLTRYTLSDWEKQGNMLVIQPNTKKQLMYFT